MIIRVDDLKMYLETIVERICDVRQSCKYCPLSEKTGCSLLKARLCIIDEKDVKNV